MENWARRLSTILKELANSGVLTKLFQSGWLMTFYWLRTLALKLFISESAYLKRYREAKLKLIFLAKYRPT